MKYYVFLSNSSKPSTEEAEYEGQIQLSNVSRPCLEAALKLGYKVIFGINKTHTDKIYCDLPISYYDSHTYRKLLNFNDNNTAYKNLCNVIRNNEVDAIHCNTPIGGVIGRLCGKKFKIRKVIYTAHGFHFYKGGNIFKNLVFKLAERIMAKYTDAIITMNQEDYENAKKFKLKKDGKVYFVNGVGIDLSSYSQLSNRKTIRKELGVNDNDILLVSAGDLIKRKNYHISIKAISMVKEHNVHYFICGNGPYLNKLKKYAKKCGVSNQIHFLGFRSDIKDIFSSADIFLFSTLQEGLPRSMMEAMACGLPCIASKIRGNVDLLDDSMGGYLCNPKSAKDFSKRIGELIRDGDKRHRMSKYNLEKIKDYDIKIVSKEIERIYREVLG